jgi:hypothetical protein
MAVTSCLFEPFRNPPNEMTIRSCMSKLYSLHEELFRQAKRENRRLMENELPFLWILTPTCSKNKLDGFRATLKDNWETGVYFLGESHKTAIVAINQLPKNQDTLWLRVLGNGETQKQAVQELITVSTENQCNYLLEILASWRKNIEINTNINDEDRELIMTLSPAYLKQREEWREEGLQTGLQTGRQEELRLIVGSLLTARFGNLDEELLAVVTSIMELSLTERTDLLLNLSQLSREELLAKFPIK